MSNLVRHSVHYNVMVKEEDKDKPVINGIKLNLPLVEMYCPTCSARCGVPMPLQVHQSSKKISVDCNNFGPKGERCSFYEDLINEECYVW